MNEPIINFGRQFQPPGMSGQTSAPSNVEEIDVPPGAPPYASGPLANPPPQPAPTPIPNLSTLAAGGTNHQEAWMAGQASPLNLPKQAPFSASEEDVPPGAGGTYYGGPLANPKPTPSPAPKNLDRAAIARFACGSGFSQPAY